LDLNRLIDPPAVAISMPISMIKAEPLRWLWPGRIPLGKLSIIVGDPGLGKSLLTVAIAASVSVGARWPDAATCSSAHVLMLSAEDDPADTIRPRLEAAGAALDRVHVFRAVREFEKDGDGSKLRDFSLRKDVAVLSDLLERLEDVRVIVIDPVSAYLDSVDSHNNAEVRGLLAPLAELAATRGVAILAVSHLNKAAGGNPLYRASGSLAFVAAARSVMLVTREEDTNRRLLLPLKQNLAPEGAGLAYEITEGANGAPIVVWHPDPVTLTAGEALAKQETAPAERTELRDAMDWLYGLLEGGPASARQIQADARDAGLSWITVRRAKDALGVRAGKTRFDGGWQWALPAKREGAHPPPCPSKMSTFANNEHLRKNTEKNANFRYSDMSLKPEDAQGAQGAHGMPDKPRQPCAACAEVAFWWSAMRGGPWRCCGCEPADARFAPLEFCEVAR
jgi:AAA domain